jgi:hypothetical protein
MVKRFVPQEGDILEIKRYKTSHPPQMLQLPEHHKDGKLWLITAGIILGGAAVITLLFTVL